MEWIANKDLASFVQCINVGNFSEAEKIISQAKVGHRLDTARCVISVLKRDDSPDNLVEDTLLMFIGSRESRVPEHGNWVKDLSEFIDLLWKRKTKDQRRSVGSKKSAIWLKQIYLIAFTNARDLGDFRGTELLVDAFARCADWDDEPKNYSLAFEDMPWIRLSGTSYQYSRLTTAFHSEEEFLKWKLNQPKFLIKQDYKTEEYVYAISRIKEVLDRCREIKVDISDITKKIQGLLERQACDLAKKAENQKDPKRKEMLEMMAVRTKVDMLGLEH